MRKLIVSLLIIGIFVGGVFAQDDDKKANIRIAHLSSDSGEIVISLNTDDILAMQETYEFADVTAWEEVNLGTFSISIVPAEAELEETLLEAEIELEAGDWITVAIIGEVEKETIAVQVLVEDYSPLDAFESRLSIFHAISNYDPVNVIVNDEELIRYLGYPGFWGPDSDGFITFDILAQSSDIRIEQEGGDVTAELEDVVLGGNRHYFLAIAGVAADPQFVLVASDLGAPETEEE
jgi:hypothetical protein